MKVALLLPGFVRGPRNIKNLLKLVKSNANVDIHVYSSTYDVMGLNRKEHANPKVYWKMSPKIGNGYFDKILSRIPHKVECEHYFEADKICNDFVTENYKGGFSTKEYWATANDKLRDGIDDDIKSMKRSYGQWRKLWMTYNLIENPDQYNIIVRSRYDLKFEPQVQFHKFKNIAENCLYAKTSVNRGILFNDGQIQKHELNDKFAIGSPETMRKYCSHGEDSVFLTRMNEFASDTFLEKSGMQANKSNELFISYLCYNVHNMKHKELNFNININRRSKGY